MALFGSIETVRLQLSPATKFEAVFTYLQELFRAESSDALRLRSMPIGVTHRVELAAGAFALEQVYRTKQRVDGFFESHRSYIDVQVVVEGQEWMELIDVSRATVRHAYDPQRDLLVYEDAHGSSLHVNAGDAAVFYPADVHMPGLHGTSGSALIRKTVIKVPVN